MKNILLLIVIASFAVGTVGCTENAEADSTAVTTPDTGNTPPPVANPNKARGPQASQAPTAQLSPYANDPRWKPGTMLRGSGK
jgi:hypothetical protein